MHRRLAASLVGVVVASSALTACTASDDGTTPDDTSAPAETAAAGGDADAPAELDFWTWTTNIEDVVAIWNEENPDQQVTVDRQAQGDELITRVLTAAQAGNDPCLIHTEYQALPVLVSNGVVADVTADFEGIRDAFPEGAWGLTSFGDQTFAVPQDIAPMMLFYREDLFAQYGLEVPTTWDEFAALAAEVREKAEPDQYLATFSSGDPGWFAGLAQQAGAEWWAPEGEAWKVGIDDEATTKLATYWGDLVSAGLIDDQPMYTPEWNAAMNDGTLLAWPTAVWGAGVLEGVAPDTAGLWRAVPMPQWSEGESRTGYWGGSGTAISASCEYPAQAAKFVTWLNTSPEALEALVTIAGVYPAATAGQTGTALEQPPVMLPNQPDFYAQASEIAGTASGFTWGPNVNVTYQAYKDAFQAAIQNGTPFADAVTTMQETTVADLKQQGYEVAE
ncbi:ABC transporter substrate-binding protein [Cellulomonas sp. KRMCY2]|uniref:ABC transporter substrate-binding protein n=1 Tax=Cellulomonas sp. KRMCY2 TaxID=1304865 RepID=UPI00045EA1BB|nr:extracellular solute-binding protein [Cellulomonas sp. KRMCY2]